MSDELTLDELRKAAELLRPRLPTQAEIDERIAWEKKMLAEWKEIWPQDAGYSITQVFDYPTETSQVIADRQAEAIQEIEDNIALTRSIIEKRLKGS